MKTESVTFEPHGDEAHKVSRALQDLAPLACELVDHRGKRVPLSSAGYVLRAGKKYCLRLVLPFDDENLDHIEILAKPDFLNVNAELTEIDESGRKVHTIPFAVHSEFGTFLKKLGTDVRCDDLQVGFYFRKGSGKHAPAYGCPVVIRPGWSFVMFAVASTVLALVAPILIHELFAANKPEGLLDRFALWPLGGRSSVALVAVVLLVIGVYAYNVFQLRQRSKELKQAYREAYNAPPT